MKADLSKSMSNSLAKPIKTALFIVYDATTTTYLSLEITDR